ncbi:neuroepithelial cell-transforming gene 1 protein isoform X2 [Hippocampus comes]|uniref:neuroepithelial cell-transforming gene 1 protein isoform X1 n=1 Tax=Hippocampus comes TaxID=109280 RepID=UPI00094E717A|nr:PREDICTED: neuroepithelial cell-transforming gene 1 protein-like isoform X1 [Hippocampus comes]XP_019721765.1 PREDICTED: neuroepithelial cell-transforming gene 1 protein-like isoform X2 [Hippocampus comes]
MVTYDELGSLVPIKRTLQVIDNQNQAHKESEEPSNKRVRPLGRVTSLANLISPVKNGAVRRFGQTIQASFRSDGKSPVVPQKPCNKAAAPTPPKRRNSTLWSETLDVHQKETLTTKEIKRQEAIFELSRGEQDLIEDLQLARKAYHDPMLKLSIMSEEELSHIFGNLDAYIPLHEDLLDQLSKATGSNGTVGQIGQIVVNWLPRLDAYKEYCSNQLAAKALLDQKKQDRRVQDFLQRCLESPFSRKLDLWSFLDIPRSRLVKYPLLLREILRHTPPEHPDATSLEQAITIIQGVLSDINMKKGESECLYYIDKLEYLDDRQRDPRLEQCKSLLCHGELRNKSGTKLHVFLFTELLVLTRSVIRNERQCFQVYRQPIPVQDLVLDDLQDGDVRMGGSFRGAFSNADKAKNIFRVRAQDPGQAQSHTLQVNDVFHKQQWLNCLRSAISVHRPHGESASPPPPPTDVRSKRRPSSVSAIVHMEETDENCPQRTTQSAPSSPCGTATPSPSDSPSSSTSSSPVPPPTSQKTKKDKKSLYSLGKRKETMV